MVNAMKAGVAGTLVVAITAILVLMFSPREPGSRAVGLFGGVYFEGADRADGSWSLGFGLMNWPAWIVVWLVVSGLAFVGDLVSARARRPRRRLAGRGPDSSRSPDQ
ncbi:hypothetical protein [Sinomonas albida]|uniref:hypothetical protein n=1 Tax=Sinomonas albida TaxID=369942 RepID=UPI0010A909E2|nr:hypothetical protein [Sinomonas albida]